MELGTGSASNIFVPSFAPLRLEQGLTRVAVAMCSTLNKIEDVEMVLIETRRKL